MICDGGQAGGSERGPVGPYTRHGRGVTCDGRQAGGSQAGVSERGPVGPYTRHGRGVTCDGRQAGGSQSLSGAVMRMGQYSLMMGPVGWHMPVIIFK